MSRNDGPALVNSQVLIQKMFKHTSLSGAAKRKKAAAVAINVKKLPKVTQFFSSATASATTSATSDSISNVPPDSTQMLPLSLPEQIELHASNTAARPAPLQTMQDTIANSDAEGQSGRDVSIGDDNQQTSDVEHLLDSDNAYIQVQQLSSLLTDTSIHSAVQSDPALWIISPDTRHFFAENQPDRNIGDFTKSARTYTDHKTGKIKTRQLTKNLFTRQLANGESVERMYLVYSPSSGSLFCWVCRLYSKKVTLFSEGGFTDWKHGNRNISEHENSISHREALMTLDAMKKSDKCIDQQVLQQFKSQCQYWRDVLKRVVATVQFLAERGLAFRGNDEQFGSQYNGNFLGIIELISMFDPFLSDHIARYGNQGTGSVSYLSKSTCEEFINLMAEEVRSHIRGELANAKYYSVIVDSTPDISKVDQLTIVVRYVLPNGEVTERFVQFQSIHSHEGAALQKSLLTAIETMNLNISDCRGQAYDNASNMTGIYSGLQTRIKSLNKLADFVPCCNHSLNLVGCSAAESCVEAVSFFGFLQTLFVFFSSSTHRWSILKSVVGISLKSLSQTRWSARADACRAVRSKYAEIYKCLTDLRSSSTESSVTRTEAGNLAAKMEKLETALMTVFWDKVMDRVNATNLSLQKVDISLGESYQMYTSLIDVIACIRDGFDAVESEAKLLVVNGADYVTTRKRQRKRQADESSEVEVQFSPRDAYRTKTFFVICDKLLTELRSRQSKYHTLMQRFDVFHQWFDMDDGKLQQAASVLRAAYEQDLKEFGDELIQMKHFFKNNDNVKNPGALLKHLIAFKDTFPNVLIALRIYMTLPSSNASGERSFSCLKRVKNYLRSTLGQDRLDALAILSIESQLGRSINFNALIDKFARIKARKKSF